MSIDVFQDVSLPLLFDWATTLTLIFGGCCSNALTLEQITNEYPHSGKLITFSQFLLISIHGLPKFVTFTPYPRLKPRQIPILPYLLQVSLFYCISLLNNAAFAYSIPMPVHIIFRSGGLMVNMLMGWVLLGRKYNVMQVSSVLLVTSGVVLTTLSASRPKSEVDIADNRYSQLEPKPYAYATGISILTLALFFSGFLGIIQDKTYSRYVPRAVPVEKTADGPPNGLPNSDKPSTPPWQEAMWYLHFLSMPMFFLVREDLVAQLQALNAGPKIEVALPLSEAPPLNASSFPLITRLYPTFVLTRSIEIPTAYLPLLLNTITQLLCVAGVHRLTARVSSLTVTLVLVIRKAVSLIISVMMFSVAGRGRMDEKGKALMWTGALLVFAGTMGYSLGTGRKASQQDKPKKE
ncbi:hypothetical protein AcW1_004138 [Taiwanofungus camphoratus]|nr:hypothetical protein AcW2_006851 [Antrodia cinnamomea]KAI0938983.1 hypothetical protein AcV5_000519 [Antrodia cinnamomea]KAI0959267.1 hypothetical protein AcW1_004138 [Antrodia cinnamomea]